MQKAIARKVLLVGVQHALRRWFQNTLPGVAPEIDDIAILRLDADWYASTKVCLEYLYDKVVSGVGTILCPVQYNKIVNQNAYGLWAK